MKEIKAIVREERINEVLDALGNAGIVNATLNQVLAMGPNIDEDASRVSVKFGRNVNRMIQVELICPDKDEWRLIHLIREQGCTATPGDGVISTRNVNRLVKIRNAAESVDAL